MPFTRLSLSFSLFLSRPYTRIYSVLPTPRYLPSFSLFPAEVRSPTGSTRPSLLYVIAVEGMGIGLRGHRIPTSVFPPRCAITHHRGTRRTELSSSCSLSIFISFLSLLALVLPAAFVFSALFLLCPSRPFSRALVYYMLNYNDLRSCTQKNMAGTIEKTHWNLSIDNGWHDHAKGWKALESWWVCVIEKWPNFDKEGDSFLFLDNYRPFWPLIEKIIQWISSLHCADFSSKSIWKT